MSFQKNIMIVGVGGQGTLLASRILGEVLLSQGYDVKVSEVHGMSQRGGSVVTYVKYGSAVASPIIDKGEADVILAFEQLEAVRWLPYLKLGGKLITNTQRMNPMPVITGVAEYPEDLLALLEGAGVDLLTLDALALAEQAGSVKAVNVVLLGALARQMEFGEEIWQDAVSRTVKPQFAAMNRRAFEMGYRGQSVAAN
ncbi:MAG: indolepyruvate oxidoreductase subunit beta [Oscillospiraceae bacterium]|jgi:indolepyruvate ferredoxin oxidoreductase beta subunit|nr:indolepyruvate oxidoreductase subunit beta [Oscillospiraceae bacterium]